MIQLCIWDDTQKGYQNWWTNVSKDVQQQVTQEIRYPLREEDIKASIGSLTAKLVADAGGKLNDTFWSPQICIKSYIEFDDERDATMFLLRWA